MLIGAIDGLPPLPAPPREGVGVPAERALADGAQAKAISQEVVSSAVAHANAALRALSQAVEFEYDPDVNVTVVRLVDTQDHQVLRQVPSPEMLEIARALDRMQVTLLRNKA
jgi:flagellar protein FlaG